MKERDRETSAHTHTQKSQLSIKKANEKAASKEHRTQFALLDAVNLFNINSRSPVRSEPGESVC